MHTVIVTEQESPNSLLYHSLSRIHHTFFLKLYHATEETANMQIISVNIWLVNSFYSEHGFKQHW